jgi:NAD(P)H dehydrogenase (quinone)
MSLVITGATGHLGRLVVEDLLGRGVPAGDITAAGRDVTKVKDLADRGVRVRHIDYDDPASLDAAFRGADRILLISASVPGDRARQHGNAIDAAARAGAGLLAYTSIANAGTTTMRLAGEHQATEAALRASGLTHVVLRNSWYTENYTAQIPAILQRGELAGSAGDGRVSAATRADYAAAAAAVLAGDGPAEGQSRVYELGGDQAFTLAELAAEISAQAGRPVSYRDLPEDEYARLLAGAGLPEAAAATMADADRGLARGDLYVDSGHLRQLIGRPTTALRDAVAAALG